MHIAVAALHDGIFQEAPEELAETLASVDLHEGSGSAAHLDHRKQQQQHHGDGERDVLVLTP